MVGAVRGIDTVYPQGVCRYALTKKKPQPIWVEVYFGGGGGIRTRVRQSAACMRHNVQ